MRKRLATVKLQLIKMRHVLLGDVGRWLGRVARGWMNYFAIPGKLRRLIRTYLPRPKIVHPYPEIRFLDRLAAGAVWGNSSRTDLCGGWPAMAIPTATALPPPFALSVGFGHAFPTETQGTFRDPGPYSTP
jgi:hypothetical protein